MNFQTRCFGNVVETQVTTNTNIMAKFKVQEGKGKHVMDGSFTVCILLYF